MYFHLIPARKIGKTASMCLIDEQIEKLKWLEDNFDSYQGKAPTKEAIDAILRLQAVPRNDGGIGIVWRTEQAEIEIDFGRDGSALSVSMEVLE